VPSSLGVNPQMTIMALATRLALGLLGRDPDKARTAPPKPMPARAADR
jgi:choline dehydrogenase-like flavoprotein